MLRLLHCVGTLHHRRAVRAKCRIFFVRRVSTQNKPSITMDNGNSLQTKTTPTYLSERRVHVWGPCGESEVYGRRYRCGKDESALEKKDWWEKVMLAGSCGSPCFGVWEVQRRWRSFLLRRGERKCNRGVSQPIRGAVSNGYRKHVCRFVVCFLTVFSRLLCLIAPCFLVGAKRDTNVFVSDDTLVSTQYDKRNLAV